ncbi:hypothetical protein PQX77_007617 [Marasmius sp. AFHP31]|nr:hypothetical protein PQX77_007617 [Marasmius sp. AFHP31]
MTVRFSISLLACVEALLMENVTRYGNEWNWALIVMLSIGSFVDLAVPCGMVYFLFIQRSGAYKTTAAIVDKLILWTIETGLATGYGCLAFRFLFADTAQASGFSHFGALSRVTQKIRLDGGVYMLAKE